jgi:putative exporter of polyketide antibiotics
VYAVVAWSFLIEMIAAVVSTNRLLLDTSLLHHIAPAPAASPDWVAAASMVGLGLVAAVAGMVAFTRRDLVTA